jgi:hypothetical protein
VELEFNEEEVDRFLNGTGSPERGSGGLRKSGK